MTRIGIAGIGLLIIGSVGIVSDASSTTALIVFILGFVFTFAWWNGRQNTTLLPELEPSDPVDVLKISSVSSAPSIAPILPIDFVIWYEDSAGEMTKRRLTPIRIDQRLDGYGASPRLHAFCHLRQESRTFLIRKIVLIRNAETDEPIFDVFAAVESRLGIATENPEKDAWEGYQYERDQINNVSAELHIKYEDSDGQRSERDVSLRKYAPATPGKYLLIAHCHLRNDTRSFHSDQVLDCIDRETGEAVLDVAEEVERRYRKSPEGALKSFVENWQPAIVAMLVIGRADGRLMRAERKIISGLCRSLARDSRLTDELIDRMLDHFPKATDLDFSRAIAKLSKRELFSRKIILRGAELLLATDKRITDEERRLVELLRTAIGS
jgi:hypothetical protein